VKLFRYTLFVIVILPSLSHPHHSEEVAATPFDDPHLILLFYLTQLFLRELVRSYHLLKIIPMDMSGYFGECRLRLIVLFYFLSFFLRLFYGAAAVN
jgi:hypothetical protein